MTKEEILKALTTDTVAFEDVQVVRRGDTVSIPPSMPIKTAIEWLIKRDQEETRVVKVNETMSGFPLDCANAMALAIQERYGFKELRSVPTMFGEKPPQFINVPVDHTGKTTEVFVGRFGIPKLATESYLQLHPNGFDSMVVVGQVKAKELPEVKELVALARQKLHTNSLYKGKAFRLEWEEQISFFGNSTGFDTPEFMAPQPNTVKLLVNEETQFLIDASIWEMIKNTERCRELGIPLKRSALCEGSYGTGKTLLAGATGDICVENGWTFIYLKDIHHLQEAYRMAARYGPCALFVEDIDLAFAGNQEEKHALLNALDGIDTKGSEVMLIMTTNYYEKLDQSILRPGRIDSIIPFTAPNRATVVELVRHYSGDLLRPDADLTTVGDLLDGQIPAVIREVVERAKLYTLAKAKKGEAVILDEVSLVHSARGMRAHMEIMRRLTPKPPLSPLEQGASIIGAYMAFGMQRAIQDPADRNGLHNNPTLAEAVRFIGEKQQS